jgi:branched-chain amino acid transport system ATP-binding protein
LDLHVSYADIEVRHGVDLEVHTGEIVALLGANAAGKSTLPQVVSGVLRPRRGMIAFAGQDVTGWPPPSVSATGPARELAGRPGFTSAYLGT